MLDPALELLQTLWHVEQGLNRISSHMKGTIGVSGRERFALRLIRTHPGLTAADFARALHVSPSTARDIIDGLRQRGLVRRMRHLAQGRVWRLYVTTAGKRVSLPDTRRTIESHLRRVLARHAPAARQNSLALLADLAREPAAPTALRAAAPSGGGRRRQRIDQKRQ